jgi:fructosamine-3-kinase
MIVSENLASWLTTHGFGAVTSTTAIGGGSISDSYLLETSRGHSFFLKTHENSPDGMYFSEGAGLRALAATKAICVPLVYTVDDDYLLLEYLSPAEKRSDYWQTLGTQLARLHQHQADQFGFEIDNFCGLTPQPNPQMDNGYDFFAEHRLLYQARIAYDKKLIKRSLIDSLERICHRLPSLVPEQAPSLVHGDLWSGNIFVGPQGQPALIDPATYYGWAETELAMTTLFGGLDDTFYQAYVETNPLESGWKQRLPLYNLYHLLNHLNLFGSGYLAQVQATIRMFA